MSKKGVKRSGWLYSKEIRLLAKTRLVSVAFTVKLNCTAPGAFLSLAAGHCYIVITNFAFSTHAVYVVNVTP